MRIILTLATAFRFANSSKRAKLLAKQKAVAKVRTPCIVIWKR